MGVRREGGGEVTIWFFCFLEKSTFVCVCLPTLCGVYLRLDFFFFFFVFLGINSLFFSLSFYLSSLLSRVIQEKNLPGQELIRESPPFPFQKKQPGPGLVGTHSLTHSPFYCQAE